MRTFRTYHEVESDAGESLVDQVVEQRARLAKRLETIGAVVAVVSGKGGVGKSAITANLAVALAERGATVGAVDADLNGPSLGKMLGVGRARLTEGELGIEPPVGVGGVRVISMDLLQEGVAAPLRWRGPTEDTFIWQSVAETGVLREFIGDLAWGELDYLLIDLPPGTDKIIRLLELVPTLQQALLVTTPSAVAGAVVARSAHLLGESGVGAVGIVANMTAFEPEGGGAPVPLFPGDGVRALVEESGLEIWSELTFDPEFGAGTDAGEAPRVLASDRAPARAILGLAARVEAGPGGREAPG